MSLINVVLWVGRRRADRRSASSGPAARGRATRRCKEEDANAERYAAWRGGVRDVGDTTGASVAMQILRRQAQIGAGIAIAGLVLVFLGFLIK